MPAGLDHDSGTTRFLIVDDHAGFRQTIRTFLPAGRVVECGDGNAALAVCNAEHPDWVLMDIEMPGLDGLSATRELKRRFPDLQIIIVSNHGEEEFRSAAMSLGVTGFLRKDHLQDLAPMIAAGTKHQGNQ